MLYLLFMQLLFTHVCSALIEHLLNACYVFFANRKETMIQSPPESEGRLKQLRQLDFLSLAPLEYDPHLQSQP